MFPFTSFRPTTSLSTLRSGRYRNTTQDSVRGCSLGFAAAVVADGRLQRACKAQRSSNRTCPNARGFGTVITLLRPSTQQSRTAPVFDGVLRLIANHHDLAIFESAPEVRALCSAGITRPQRSYDPVRLPPWPPPSRR